MPSKMSRDLQILLQVQQAAIEGLGKRFDPTEIAFRVIGNTKTSHSDGKLHRECVRDVGILSRGSGSRQIWNREVFRQHCAGLVMDPPSPYISISTNPRRILNLLPDDDTGMEVVLINLSLLKKLNRHCRSTIDLAATFGLTNGEYIDGHVPFITESHLLVHEFIPHACLLAFVAANRFKEVCIMNGVGDSRDIDYRKTLWNLLKPYKSTRSAFWVTSSFDSSSERSAKATSFTKVLSTRRHRPYARKVSQPTARLETLYSVSRPSRVFKHGPKSHFSGNHRKETTQRFPQSSIRLLKDSYRSQRIERSPPRDRERQPLQAIKNESTGRVQPEQKDFRKPIPAGQNTQQHATGISGGPSYTVTLPIVHSKPSTASNSSNAFPGTSMSHTLASAISILHPGAAGFSALLPSIAMLPHASKVVGSTGTRSNPIQL